MKDIIGNPMGKISETFQKRNSKSEKKEKNSKRLFEEIVGDKFFNLRRKMRTFIQEAQIMPNKKCRQSNIKTYCNQKSRTNEKLFLAAIKKYNFIYQGK